MQASEAPRNPEADAGGSVAFRWWCPLARRERPPAAWAAARTKDAPSWRKQSVFAVPKGRPPQQEAGAARGWIVTPSAAKVRAKRPLPHRRGEFGTAAQRQMVRGLLGFR